MEWGSQVGPSFQEVLSVVLVFSCFFLESKRVFLYKLFHFLPSVIPRSVFRKVSRNRVNKEGQSQGLAAWSEGQLMGHTEPQHQSGFCQWHCHHPSRFQECLHVKTEQVWWSRCHDNGEHVQVCVKRFAHSTSFRSHSGLTCCCACVCRRRDWSQEISSTEVAQ